MEIIQAIKTLYENNINPGSEAMQHVFTYIDELETKKPKETKGAIMSKSRINDEIAQLITRYTNDGGLMDDTLSDFWQWVKDDQK